MHTQNIVGHVLKIKTTLKEQDNRNIKQRDEERAKKIKEFAPKPTGLNRICETPIAKKEVP